jgi:TetR/AcrR family transcriptional repressor of nem operon
MAEPATERGRETRERILLAAARLFHERGVTATSVDEVLSAAAAGKGQFYRYFSSKEELVSAVVDRQLDLYLGWQLEALNRLETSAELEGYLDDLVVAHRGRGLVGGCPVGSLALELAGQDERLRRRLAESLDLWEAALTTGLSRLAAGGELRTDVPPRRLAASLLASIQGAYLLSTVRKDAEVMGAALDEALDHLLPGRANRMDGTASYGTE